MAINVTEVAGSFINIGIIIVVAVVLLTVGGISAYFYLQSKKYGQFICILFGKDAFNNAIMEKDQAGIFVDDKTSLKRFFMKRHRVGLDPDKVKYVQFGKYKYVFLRKYSLKNFAFIDVTAALRDDNPTLLVTEQDVNWAIHEYRKHKTLDTKNIWKEWAPVILWAFTIVAGLILAAWILKKFDILNNIAGTIGTASEALKQAAHEIAAAKSGTTVIQ